MKKRRKNFSLSGIWTWTSWSKVHPWTDELPSFTLHDALFDTYEYRIFCWSLLLAFLKVFGWFDAIRIPIFSGESWDEQHLIRFFKSRSVFLYGASLLSYLEICNLKRFCDVFLFHITRVQILDNRGRDDTIFWCTVNQDKSRAHWIK